MGIYRCVTLYYGYAKDFSTTEEEPKEEAWKIDEDIEVSATKINRDHGNGRIVIGKEIEKAGEADFEEITASELLNRITSIKDTEMLNKKLEKLGMEDQEPRLIICSEVS